MSSRPPGLLTMADVARLAEVSVPTVSRVINGRENVAPQTRERVEAVLRSHGYRHVKKPEEGKVIELLLDRLESRWAKEIVQGVMSSALERGYGVLLSEGGRAPTSESRWLKQVLSRRSVAVVSVSEQLSDEGRESLQSRSIPLVTLEPRNGPVHGLPSAGATNWSAGYAAARHLFDLGHRRIGAVGRPEDRARVRAWLDGCRAALAPAGGVVFRPMWSGGSQVDDGYRAARELLRQPGTLTAIVAESDLQAIGVYRAAQELGLRVPQDLSVVGYDDLRVADWISPRLTTIRRPMREIARAAAALAIDLSQGRAPVSAQMEMATPLVVRESTARSPW